MRGDLIDRELEQVARRHTNESLELSFGDYAMFVGEALVALVPLGLAIATGRLRLGTLLALLFFGAIIFAIFLGIRSLRRFYKRLERMRDGSH